MDEVTICYRPTRGEEISEGIFRVLPTINYDSEDEIWQFTPGTVVRCESRILCDTDIQSGMLIAVEKVS